MKKRLSSALLALALVLGLLPGTAMASDVQPVSSRNKNRQDYSTWASTVKSYLYENESGGLTRVEYVDSQVVVEDYDSSFQYLSGRIIEPELPIWGGFFTGEQFNFLIYGQRNPGQDDSTEVIRVVKYDKDWERLGQASLKGANTTVPFDAGSLRCDEYGGYLYIRTCHEMYKSSDGLNHQSNLTMAVRQSDMAITDSYYSVMNSSYGYISHSFNQFLLVDEDGKLVALDHGDAYPRGVVYCKYYADAGTGKFSGGQYSRWCACGNMIDFAGPVGDNTTGASVGGLAETTDCYIMTYNYDKAGGRGDRYPYYHWMDKATGKSWSAQLTQTPGCTTPVLAPIGLDGGFLLWNGKSGGKVSDALYYLQYGADGKPGETKSATGSLSDCQPISYNGKAVWYVTDSSAPVFYALDADGVTITPAGGGSLAPCEHAYVDAVTPPTCTQRGFTAHTCSKCGEVYVDSYTDALGHSYGDWEVVTPATATADGLSKRVCARCGVDEARAIPATGPQTPDVPKFADVADGAYYADAVKWAVENEITVGTSPTTFSPDRDCTQVQILTFLWRAAGEYPSTHELPVDITGKNVDYADTALRWAYEKGMIDESFDLASECTRSVAVSYIWQAFGSFKAKEASSFTDVAAGSKYAEAVSWAVENGVTNGLTESTFGPDKVCRRGQIATFLHRAYVESARLK